MANKIGIDTNVLVRYIAQDDEQSQIAMQFLQDLSLENWGFVNNIVVVELIWALSRIYRQSKKTIAIILDDFQCLCLYLMICLYC